MLTEDFQLAPNQLIASSSRLSAVPNLIHGITTRTALPSPGKADFFDSITQARTAGALPNVLALGADQVHSDRLVLIDEPIGDNNRHDGFRWNDQLRAGEFPKADALVTTLPGVLLIIQTADCLPVFAIDADNKIAGLAHCGWRGLRAGLAGNLITQMISSGADPNNIQVWLGPCIHAANYEVSRELVEDFRQAFPNAPVAIDDRHLDLPAVAQHQIEQVGIAPNHIADSGQCTFALSDRYHSWRAHGPTAGRMLSFVGFSRG